VAGLDTTSGLKRTGGKPGLYVKLVKQFAAELGRMREQLRDATSTGKLDDAQRLAHSLKGVAANLGADRLSQLAADLERDLVEGADPETACAALDRELEAFTGTLRRELGLTSAERAPSPFKTIADRTDDGTVLPRWLEQLTSLLSEGDVRAQSLWDQHAADIAQFLSPEGYQRARRAVENFEFDMALEALTIRQPEA
jgi:two-component system sensor histidine kinase/response regulator